MGTLRITSMVSHRTGEPRVSIYWPKDREAFQLSPLEARQLALSILAAAECAIGDAFMFAYMKDMVHLDVSRAATMLNDFRRWRDKVGVDGPGWGTEEVEGEA